jgi:DNA-binding NarL/FixJ family response regulator
MTVAIALADDSVIVREGVARVLAAQPDMQVVVSCGDLPSLLEAVESERPDVVVTDIRMPPTSTDEGIRAAVLLREQHPDIGVAVLSNYAEPAYAMACWSPARRAAPICSRSASTTARNWRRRSSRSPPAAPYWTPRSSNRSSQPRCASSARRWPG